MTIVKCPVKSLISIKQLSFVELDAMNHIKRNERLEKDAVQVAKGKTKILYFYIYVNKRLLC